MRAGSVSGTIKIHFLSLGGEQEVEGWEDEETVEEDSYGK